MADPLAVDPLARDCRTVAPAAGRASVAAPGAEGTKAAVEPLVRVAPASATADDWSGPPVRAAAMRAADCAFGPGSPGCAPTAIVDEDHPDEDHPADDRTADDRVARRTVPRSMPRPRRASSAQPGRWLARWWPAPGSCALGRESGVAWAAAACAESAVREEERRIGGAALLVGAGGAPALAAAGDPAAMGADGRAERGAAAGVGDAGAGAALVAAACDDDAAGLDAADGGTGLPAGRPTPAGAALVRLAALGIGAAVVALAARLLLSVTLVA